MRSRMATQTVTAGADDRVPDNRAMPELRTRIALRAYQLFEESGRVQGHDLDNWLRAEQEVVADDLE